MINNTMGLTPPIALKDIEMSHRLGPKTDMEGRPRTRATIVRFRTERIVKGVLLLFLISILHSDLIQFLFVLTLR